MVSKIFVFPLLLVSLMPLLAQEPLSPPGPFVTAKELMPPAGNWLERLNAARSAQDAGLPSIAVGLYREVLAAPPGAGGDRTQITLALVSALLDDGDVAGAGQVLQGFVGLRGSAWHLRAGLIAAHLKKMEEAKAELLAVRREDLAPQDAGWLSFLQGMVADAAGEITKARDAYVRAEGEAVSSLQRARFLLAREYVQLRLGSFSAADVDSARKNAEKFQGQKIGYTFSRQYAVVLDATGRRSEAVAALQRQLFALPAEERGVNDDFRLLLGIMAGAGEDGVGRNALSQLLAHGSDPVKQRIALQLLANASLRGPASARADFRRKLDGLISASPAHPILEDLLLFRAQVALIEKNSGSYLQAETDAKTLLEKFPGSQLKAHANGILTSVAWEQHRYRTAADYAQRARTSLPPGQAHAELGVLIAEAWYRYGDYRSAADAYGAALAERPDGVKAGVLMFQRVLAEIEAARSDPAQEAERLLAVQGLLDTLARDSGFDVENRWQAEWNLARALQVAHQTGAAYARVNKLLASSSGATNLPELKLRVRMAWLQAQLSRDAKLPEQTLKLAEALLGTLGSNATAGLEADLRTELASTTILLRAQANFDLGREAAAIDVLEKLRTDYPNSLAAIYSFIVAADYYGEKDRTDEAQKLLATLADKFPDSSYAPLALYQAALLDERRGQDTNANNRLEQLVTRYPASDLVFTARLKQGDLLRKLNRFPLAEQTYDDIIRKFPRHQGVLAAKLALADCHSAQVAVDPAHADRARELYEGLLAWPDASVDLRVEAGVKLGENYVTRGNLMRAEQVWWSDVVDAFLLKPANAAKLNATGRFWMSRALLRLGDLREQQAKLEEARQAWSLILKMTLPGETVAKSKLARFKPAEAKP